MRKEFHRHLTKALEARWEGDYGERQGVLPEEAAEHIQHAKEFLEMAEGLLGPLRHEDEDQT